MEGLCKIYYLLTIPHEHDETWGQFLSGDQEISMQFSF